MEKLNLDFGVKEYEINGRGVLRFSPSDPGLYSRLAQLMDDLDAKQKELKRLSELQKQETDFEVAKDLLQLMDETDRFIKDRLTFVFGKENDFDQIFDGVSTLAVASNGNWAVTNLLNALLPEIQAGAERYGRQRIDEAVTQAQKNRAQRRATK